MSLVSLLAPLGWSVCLAQGREEGGAPVNSNMKDKHMVPFTQVPSSPSHPLTLHGVSLACSSLSISEDGAIVPLEYRVHHSPEGLVIQVSLPGAVAGSEQVAAYTG